MECDQLKTAFVQNLSHEICTPLHTIIGFSALLNNDDLTKQDIKEFTVSIKESGNLLIEIVHHVLGISKIQTGQVRLIPKPILIKSIFPDLLDLFNPIANSKILG